VQQRNQGRYFTLRDERIERYINFNVQAVRVGQGVGQGLQGKIFRPQPRVKISQA